MGRPVSSTDGLPRVSRPRARVCPHPPGCMSGVAPASRPAVTDREYHELDQLPNYARLARDLPDPRGGRWVFFFFFPLLQKKTRPPYAPLPPAVGEPIR